MLNNTKIALITGASRGIGAAVAKKYAAEGVHVILAARTLKDLEKIDDEIQANGGKATIVQLDLMEHDKIDQLAANVAEKFGKLDVLVGNAAMLGELMPLTHVTPKIWDKVINLNLTANWRLIRAFDPLLKKSDAGKAIFVSSGVTNAAYAYWGPYSVSKAGLEMLANTYAAECAKTKIEVEIIDPGVVATKMRAQAFPGEDPELLDTPEKVAASLF